MPHASSHTFLRELFIRSGDISVAGGRMMATGMSPLPNLSGLAPALLPSGAGPIDLIDLIATIPFQHADLHAKDILGHVYDWNGATKSLPKESPKGERGGAHQYFLGQFALAEGKKGGQYFTPKSIVSLIVEMIEPYQGRVYDPAMGSGCFFVLGPKGASDDSPRALPSESSHQLALRLVKFGSCLALANSSD